MQPNHTQGERIKVDDESQQRKLAQDRASQTDEIDVADCRPAAVQVGEGELAQKQQRSDSRVSFQLNDDEPDQKGNRAGRPRAGGRISADSGMGHDQTNSPVSRHDHDSPHSDSRAAAPAQTPYERAEEPEDSMGDAELAELMAVWSPCESPALECVQAELTRTPVRRRPKIAIDKPRAKSPLLRAGSGRWSASPLLVARSKQQHRAQADQHDVKVGKKSFLLQTYSDSLRRRAKARPSVTEVECKYDFSDDDDEQDDSESGNGTSRNSRLFVTIYESADSTPNEEDSQRGEEEAAESLRLLNTAIDGHDARSAHEPAQQNRSQPSGKQVADCDGKSTVGREWRMATKQNLSSPTRANFTIGPYESLPRRHNLKIL